jgi:putative membrane protein
MTPQPTVARHPLPWILLLSAAISVFLIWLIYLKAPSPTEAGWVAVLPAVNALCNTLCACCLIGGWVFIRRGNRTVHIRFMLSAVGFSALFFIGYVVYHNFHGDTPFPGQGMIRPIYFFILISHIILSIVILPLVLSTLYYAARQQFTTHRKIARYTLPLWLYVSISGVVVFFMLQAYP